jgi:vinculin
MPPALNRVEEASILLIQASDMLHNDPFSAPARKKLIEGSRGKHIFYIEDLSNCD